MITGFTILLWLLCAINHADQELDDQTEIVKMISDSYLTLLIPDHNVTMCVCVCVYMPEHVFTSLYVYLLCITALHQP